MHALVGEDEILAWVGDPLTTDAHFAAMADWLPQLGEDPEGVSTAVLIKPHWRGYIAHVPNTLAWVDYAVSKNPDTIIIANVENHTEAELNQDPEPN